MTAIPFVLSLSILAAAWAAPQPAAAADLLWANASVGRVEVVYLGPTSRRITSAWECPAVLITQQAVLTTASCFDRFAGLPADQFETSFVLPGTPTTREFAAALHGLQMMPGYRRVRCGSPDDADICRRATTFCERRFASDYLRSTCLGSLSFFARAFVEQPSDDLAVLFLDRPSPQPGMAVAAAANGWLGDRGQLDLLEDEAENRNPVPQFVTRKVNVDRLSKHDVDVDSLEAPGTIEGADRRVQLAFVTGVDAEQQSTPTLFALPSHFAPLLVNPAVSPTYRYSRLDASLGWLRRALSRGCAGERAGCAALRLATPQKTTTCYKPAPAVVPQAEPSAPATKAAEGPPPAALPSAPAAVPQVAHASCQAQAVPALWPLLLLGVWRRRRRP